MIGSRQVYPVLRPFPVWRRMLVTDTDRTWCPDWYATREVRKGQCATGKRPYYREHLANRTCSPALARSARRGTDGGRKGNS